MWLFDWLKKKFVFNWQQIIDKWFLFCCCIYWLQLF